MYHSSEFLEGNGAKREMANNSLFSHLGAAETPSQTSSEDGGRASVWKNVGRASLPWEVVLPGNAILSLVHRVSKGAWCLQGDLLRIYATLFRI